MLTGGDTSEHYPKPSRSKPSVPAPFKRGGRHAGGRALRPRWRRPGRKAKALRVQVTVATTQTMQVHCAAKMTAATPSRVRLTIVSRRSGRGCHGILASSCRGDGGRGERSLRARRRGDSWRRRRPGSKCAAITRFPAAGRTCRSPRHRRVPRRGECDRDGSEGGIGYLRSSTPTTQHLRAGQPDGGRGSRGTGTARRSRRH
jgi:hypothetical protein